MGELMAFGPALTLAFNNYQHVRVFEVLYAAERRISIRTSEIQPGYLKCSGRSKEWGAAISFGRQRESLVRTR